MQSDSNGVPASRISCNRETVARPREKGLFKVRPFVAPETRRQIAGLIEDHDRTLREVARLTGFNEREVLRIYRAWKDLEIDKAYEAGRSNPPPPATMRRAA